MANTTAPDEFRAEVRRFTQKLPADLRHKVMNNLKLEKED